MVRQVKQILKRLTGFDPVADNLQISIILWEVALNLNILDS